MRCPKCGGYSFDDRGVCKTCGDSIYPIPPRKDLGKVDIFKMADGLENKYPTEPPVKIEKDSKQNTCPKCGLPTLTYNKFAKKFECINKWCPKRELPSTSE